MEETNAPPPGAEADLGELLRRIALGDRMAFAAFYKATVRTVSFVAGKICGSHVEDVVADAYLQLWSERTAYDPLRAGPMTWIVMLARSRALDCARRELLRHGGAAMFAPAFDAALLEDAGGSCPVEALMRKQNTALLGEALARISGHERWLLSLAFFKDLSHSEIAESTALPLGTVKSHLRRAVHRLKASLAPL